ncbi:Uncharacterised protein [Chromobacterium vaccinii]|nr:Uncharacterised protein [Chromobacterium vaccinii]
MPFKRHPLPPTVHDGSPSTITQFVCPCRGQLTESPTKATALPNMAVVDDALVTLPPWSVGSPMRITRFIGRSRQRGGLYSKSLMYCPVKQARGRVTNTQRAPSKPRLAPALHAWEIMHPHECPANATGAALSPAGVSPHLMHFHAPYACTAASRATSALVRSFRDSWPSIAAWPAARPCTVRGCRPLELGWVPCAITDVRSRRG